MLVTMVSFLVCVFYYFNNDKTTMHSALPTTRPLFLISPLALGSY